jgi:hypothetical protein
MRLTAVRVGILSPGGVADSRLQRLAAYFQVHQTLGDGEGAGQAALEPGGELVDEMPIHGVQRDLGGLVDRARRRLC